LSEAETTHAEPPPPKRLARLAVAALVLLASALLVWGAAGLPSDSGYQGVGPNFLPWVVALALAVCGLGLVWESVRRESTPDNAALGKDVQANGAPNSWVGFAYVSAAMLANAVLIEHVGFIVSCALCFCLAARGWRVAEGRPLGLNTAVTDALLGAAISAPVFWLFTLGLGVSLPALIKGGWI
jgi:putative tricarboxylic transport membrane protein